MASSPRLSPALNVVVGAVQKAVTAFQEKYELETDGIVGPATWERLNSPDGPIDG